MSNVDMEYPFHLAESAGTGAVQRTTAWAEVKVYWTGRQTDNLCWTHGVSA
jgi:hypothetical protein